MDLGAQRQQQATERAEALAKEFADYEEKDRGRAKGRYDFHSPNEAWCWYSKRPKRPWTGSVGDAVGKLRSEGRKELRGGERKIPA